MPFTSPLVDLGQFCDMQFCLVFSGRHKCSLSFLSFLKYRFVPETSAKCDSPVVGWRYSACCGVGLGCCISATPGTPAACVLWSPHCTCPDQKSEYVLEDLYLKNKWNTIFIIKNVALNENKKNNVIQDNHFLEKKNWHELYVVVLEYHQGSNNLCG